MPAFTTRPEIRGTFGVVATPHWLASSVAMSVLEKGGNAFDAAVAAGFTLQVVEPHLNGPLGQAPILVYSAKHRRCDMICGQGVAPAAATIVRFKSLGLDLIPGTGLLAATVPGAFDAWMRLLRDYGTMPLPELMAPALGYAEQGYPVVGRIRDTIMTVAELFRREWPTSAAVYLPGGQPPVPGKLFRNPALAATYKRVLAEAGAGGKASGRDQIIERARDAWYRGFVAEAIDRFCRTQKVLDASGRRHGGLLNADDMARWQAPIEAPLTYDYRGYTAVNGGLEGAAGPGIGEPTVGMYDGIGEPTTSPLGAVAGDTVHLDIIDRWSNMVSATPSGGWLQSSPVIPELGFCLGTRLQISWLDEKSPSGLMPGKRPRSTLSPTLALKNGVPWMAFGTPGGDGQDQWSTQLFLHHVHHGMNLQEAIDCPEFNNDHAPSSFYPRAAHPGSLLLEGRFPETTLRALAERGHTVRYGETWSGGRLTACAREETPEGTILKAGANPRGMQTYAVGR